MRDHHQATHACAVQSAERPALQPRRSLHSHHVVDEGQGRPGMEEAQDEWKPAAAELKDGMAFMLPAARTRANATYYGFIVLSLGIIVMVRNCASGLLKSMITAGCCRHGNPLEGSVHAAL